MSRRSSWKEEWTPLLGTVPDRQLAASLGVGYWTVYNKRATRGIPAFGRPRAETLPYRLTKATQNLVDAVIQIIDEFDELPPGAVEDMNIILSDVDLVMTVVVPKKFRKR